MESFRNRSFHTLRGENTVLGPLENHGREGEGEEGDGGGGGICSFNYLQGSAD